MKKVEKYIQKTGMIQTKDRVIAGISGGADSVCLFFVLLELQKKMDIEFIAVHVNHQLREAAADADEHFVEALCKQYGIKLEIFHKDVVSIAEKRKQSFEEAGRAVRREAFEETLQKYHGTKIALAHHQNDNAETLLMNLSRGTGLKGLCGIRPMNGRYIRPLLCMSRSEIEEFLTERGQSFCIDETNYDTVYTRNRLRHQVIPILEENVNSKAVRHMNETMEQLCEVEAYLTEQVERLWKYCVREQEEGLLLKKEKFQEQPVLLKKMLIRRCIEHLDGGLRDVGQIHVMQILELFEKQSGRQLDLPKQIRASRNYDGVLLYKMQTNPLVDRKDNRKSAVEEKGQHTLPKEEWSQELLIPGENKIPERNLVLRCTVFSRDTHFSMQNIPQKSYTKWFDYDIIQSSLCVRTKRSGDKIIIHKGQSKKLKSWFINEKIPAEDRDKILLLADGEQILWIIGYRMSSGYQITEQTRRILQVEITEEE